MMKQTFYGGRARGRTAAQVAVLVARAATLDDARACVEDLAEKGYCLMDRDGHHIKPSENNGFSLEYFSLDFPFSDWA